MLITSPRKAWKYFESKMEFTTGPVELKQMIDDQENINIIDVRKPQDYQRSHIPGAISLPRDSWSVHLSLSKDKMNIIYCYSEDCHLAADAARQFAEHGFPVMELQGGFEGWRNNSFPTES